MLVVILIPLIIVVASAIASVVFVRLSYLRITSEGVEYRNYPQPPRRIPLAQVDRFEATPKVGYLSSLRPATAALVLTDGSRLPVRRITAPDAGYGVDALNARVDQLR